MHFYAKFHISPLTSALPRLAQDDKDKPRPPGRPRYIPRRSDARWFAQQTGRRSARNAGVGSEQILSVDRAARGAVRDPAGRRVAQRRGDALFRGCGTVDDRRFPDPCRPFYRPTPFAPLTRSLPSSSSLFFCSPHPSFRRRRRYHYTNIYLFSCRSAADRHTASSSTASVGASSSSLRYPHQSSASSSSSATATPPQSRRTRPGATERRSWDERHPSRRSGNSNAGVSR